MLYDDSREMHFLARSTNEKQYLEIRKPYSYNSKLNERMILISTFTRIVGFPKGIENIISVSWVFYLHG